MHSLVVVNVKNITVQNSDILLGVKSCSHSGVYFVSRRIWKYTFNRMSQFYRSFNAILVRLADSHQKDRIFIMH